MGLPLAETARPLARRVVPGRLRGPGRFVLGQWRRSIQLRVVAATVALGILVVLVVGQLLLQRITSGIIASRQEAVIAQSAQDFEQPRKDLTTGGSEQTESNRLGDAVNVLAGPNPN